MTLPKFLSWGMKVTMDVDLLNFRGSYLSENVECFVKKCEMVSNGKTQQLLSRVTMLIFS